VCPHEGKHYLITGTIRSLSSSSYRHRARHIRSKRLALTDSVAMAEVLGIAPTSSSTSIALARDSTSGSASATPVGVLEEIEKLTTSTKSVMDYFKEKLLAKSNAASESTTPSAADMDDDIAPRRGLGALNASSISMLSFVGAPQSTCESQTLPSSDAVVEPESAKKRKAVAVSFASAEGAQTTGEDDTAARKAAKRARKAAKQVAQATDEVILTTTSEAQAPIPYDSHPVDENLLEDDDPRAAAKRAHKKAKRLAKAAASSIPIESVTSQQESKEEKKRR
jgi:Pin2-interacting protein X1